MIIRRLNWKLKIGELIIYLNRSEIGRSSAKQFVAYKSNEYSSEEEEYEISDESLKYSIDHFPRNTLNLDNQLTKLEVIQEEDEIYNI